MLASQRKLFLFLLYLSFFLAPAPAEAELPKPVRSALTRVGEFCLKSIVQASSLREYILDDGNNSLLAHFNRMTIIEALIRRFPDLKEKRNFLLSLGRMEKGNNQLWILSTDDKRISLSIYTGDETGRSPFALKLRSPDPTLISALDLQHYFDWAAHRYAIEAIEIKKETDTANATLSVRLPKATTANQAVGVMELIAPLLGGDNFGTLVQFIAPDTSLNRVSKLILSSRDARLDGGTYYLRARIRVDDFYRTLRRVTISGWNDSFEYEVVSADGSEIRLTSLRGNANVRYQRLEEKPDLDGCLYEFALTEIPRD